MKRQDVLLSLAGIGVVLMGIASFTSIREPVSAEGGFRPWTAEEVNALPTVTCGQYRLVAEEHDKSTGTWSGSWYLNNFDRSCLLVSGDQLLFFPRRATVPSLEEVKQNGITANSARRLLSGVDVFAEDGCLNVEATAELLANAPR